MSKAGGWALGAAASLWASGAAGSTPWHLVLAHQGVVVDAQPVLADGKTHAWRAMWGVAVLEACSESRSCAADLEDGAAVGLAGSERGMTAVVQGTERAPSVVFVRSGTGRQAPLARSETGEWEVWLWTPPDAPAGP